MAQSVQIKVPATEVVVAFDVNGKELPLLALREPTSVAVCVRPLGVDFSANEVKLYIESGAWLARAKGDANYTIVNSRRPIQSVTRSQLPEECLPMGLLCDWLSNQFLATDIEIEPTMTRRDLIPVNQVLFAQECHQV